MTEKADGDSATSTNAHQDQRVGDATASSASRYAWRMPALVLAFSLAFFYIAFLSFTFKEPALASRCKMAWMSPGYLRMDGLTEQHSRLARKYALWLYREQGWDLSNKVCAMPL